MIMLQNVWGNQFESRLDVEIPTVVMLDMHHDKVEGNPFLNAQVWLLNVGAALRTFEFTH